MRRIAAVVAMALLAASISVAEAGPAFAVGEPDPPTGVTATAGDGQADVSWTAANDNGSAIIEYRVSASPGSGSCTTSGTSCTVTGLNNGTSYTFTVIANNANGDSLASADSNIVTPTPAVTTPGTPTGVAASAGDASATVTWNPPADDGGSPITGYIVTSNPGNVACSTGPSPRTCLFTGLTNGQPYTFRVAALNVKGAGPQSGPSSPVTPLPPAVAPDAPTGVAATAGDGSATVTWAAPLNNGGSPITGYTVTSTPGGATCSANATPRRCVVNGLANGTPYTFTVIASNSVGDSPASAPSAAVVPAGGPGAPTNVVAVAGNGAALITWVAGSDNGSPITAYTVTASPGGLTCGWTPVSLSLSCTINGLTNGTLYTFRVTATNAIGTSTASLASTPVAPQLGPGPVGRPGVLGGRGKAYVSWATPLDSGGSPVTSYQVTATWLGGGVRIYSGIKARGLVATGLPILRDVSFAIRAINADPANPAVARFGLPVIVVAGGTRLTMASYPAAIVYGGRSRVLGLARTGHGVLLRGFRLVVQYRSLGSLSWVGYGFVRTNSRGLYGFRARPRANTEYRAVFNGSPRLMGTPSAPMRLGVAWRIRARVSARSVAVGKSVTFSGRVVPIRTAKTVLLQKVENGRWVTKQAVKTTGRGGFRFATSPKKVGVFRYRVFLSATYSHLAAGSAPMRLRVKPKPKPAPKPKPKPGSKSLPAFSVTLAVSATSLFSGSTVIFSGRVVPSNQPKVVLLQKYENGTWVTKQSAKSLASGAYRIAYTPSKKGSFTYRTYVSGTSAHRAGSSRRVVLRVL